MKTVADESEDIEATTGQVASNLAKVLKYTKETSSSMAGIDELNVISSSPSVSGFDSLFPAKDLVKATSSIDEALADYNNRMTETGGIFDKIEAKWTAFFGKLKGIFTTSREAISELINTIFTGEKNRR